MNYKIIRKPRVLEILGISKSTLHNYINQGLFPKPISIGDRAVGFIEEEIYIIIKLRVLGATNDTIKHAVREIIAKRGLLDE